MSTVTRIKICELRPNEMNAMIVALVIAKSEPRKVAAWKGQGEERCVFNFTLRDSPNDTINTTVWGSESYIKELNETFEIGDVVVISAPRVSFRPDSSIEKYCPCVTSAFTLTLNESHSKLFKSNESDIENFASLLHIPIKQTSSFLTLADIERQGNSTNSEKIEKVDLLVGVSKVCNIRSLRRKTDGMQINCCTILLMDFTVNGIALQLWNNSLINRAKHWIPGRTTDASIEKNEWNKRITVSVNSRTIITEDPACNEAEMLRQFTIKAPLQLIDQLENVTANITNPKSINTVMTIKQIQEILSEENNSSRQLYALVFCTPISLDLDGDSPVTGTKCFNCHNMVDSRIGICEKCETNESTGYFSSTFDIKVSLADHTATISNVRLTGNTAQHVLGITANDFNRISSQQKTALKWKLLLERCAVRLVILKELNRHAISIIECECVDPREASARYPVN